MITTSQKAQIIAALGPGRKQASWFRDLSLFGSGGGPTRITPGVLAAAQITGADFGTPQYRAAWLVLALSSHPDQLFGEVGSAKSIGSWARDLCRSRGEDGKLQFNHGRPAEILFQSLVAGSQRAQGGDEALLSSRTTQVRGPSSRGGSDAERDHPRPPRAHHSRTGAVERGAPGRRRALSLPFRARIGCTCCVVDLPGCKFLEVFWETTPHESTVL